MMLMHTAFSIVWIVHAFLVWFGAGGSVPQSQINALEALYSSAGGDGWIWKSNYSQYGVPWDFTAVGSGSNAQPASNPCGNSSSYAWQGLTCTPNCGDTSAVCDITAIQLSNYSMVGTLPPALGDLAQLQSLNLRFNRQLCGEVPSTVGSLALLTEFAVAEDSLTGPFPAALLDLSNLVVFDMDNNDISGTIPSGVANWALLEVFVVSFNSKLSGTIPPELGNLTKIGTFSIASSRMTGTVPSSLGCLINLVFFSVRENSFTGGLPLAILDAPNISFFLVGDNFLSGNFQGVAVPPSLQILRLDHNYFSGSFLLPQLCDINLFEILANSNLFSGTLPTCLGNWNHTHSIDLGENHFSGTIPSTFRALTSLNIIVLGSNFFSGSLDGMFPLSVHDTDVAAGSDDITLPLPVTLPPINYNIHPNLVSVIVSDNGFTGSLPYHLFNTSVLKQFIATKNCFSGSLSSDICLATSLQTLSLSGLTAGSGCVYELLGLGSYTSVPMPGDIPSCIYSMPALEQLYVAGNGIISRVGDVPGNSTLKNVSMSFNRLHGRLPISIQQLFSLQNLDMSFNHLIGDIRYMTGFNLNASAPRHTNINLDRNILSGPIPSSFKDGTTDIAILNGNTFTCLEGKDTLPQNDPKADSYACGSDLLNFTMYGSAIAVAVVAIYLGYYFVDKHREATQPSPKHLASESVHSVPVENVAMFTCLEAAETAVRYMFSPVGTRSKRDVAAQDAAATVHMAAAAASGDSVGDGDGDCKKAGGVSDSVGGKKRPRLSSLSPVAADDSGVTFLINKIWFVLVGFRRFAALITLYICTLFAPVYVGISVGNDNSQTFQYGWVLSLAFLRGYGAGIAIAVLWLVLLVGSMAYEMRYIDRNPFIAIKENPPKSSRFMRQVRKIVLIMLNVLISCMANGAYVYVVLTASLNWQIVAAGGLVVFKLSWLYLIAVPWLEREAANGRFILILISCMFNIIIIPALATMVVDVQCFERLFISSPPIITTYSYGICGSFDQGTDGFDCLRFFETGAEVSFTAPFIYSELCFTALLTNYIPIYVLTYGVVGLAIPVLQILLTIYIANATIRGNMSVTRWVRWAKSIDWYPLFYLFPIESVNDLQVVLPADAAAVAPADVAGWSSKNQNPRPPGVAPMATSSESAKEEEQEEEEGGRAGDEVARASSSTVVGGGPPSVARDSCASSVSTTSSTFGLRAPSLMPGQLTHRRHMYLSRFCAMTCVILLTLLFTFGVTYPPLAVLLLLCICCVTVAFQLSVYFHSRQLESLGPECVGLWEKILADELRDLHRILYGSRTAVYIFASIYACFAVYELTSRNTGLMLALLLLLLVATVVVAAYVKRRRRLDRRNSVLARRRRTVQTVMVGENFIEMHTLVVPEEWKDNLTLESVDGLLRQQRLQERQSIVGGLLAVGDLWDDDNAEAGEDIYEGEEGDTTNPMQQQAVE